MNKFKDGIKKSLPIAISYFAVSFTFGVMASSGLTPLMATFMSLTNITSSGEFAGTKLIFVGASFLEIFFTVLLINLRYSLMSVSLTQKLDKSVKVKDKLLWGFGITDEIFALSIKEEEDIKSEFMYGMTLLPILAWTIGTLFGALFSNILPERLVFCFTLALYSMFITIIIPDAKRNYKVLFVVVLAGILSVIFNYVPFINTINEGLKIIIPTIIAAVLGALIYPLKEEN